MEKLGIHNMGEVIAFGIVAIGLLLGLGFGGKMLLGGVALVILAIGALAGIVLYGNSMIVAIVAIVGFGTIAYILTRIQLGNKTTIYHIGRDGDINAWTKHDGTD